MYIQIEDLELSDTILACVTIEFRYVHRGCPEFEVIDCWVDYAYSSTCHDDKPIWEKSKEELGDWWIILNKRLGEIVEDIPDLHELQYDDYANNGDY